MMSLASPQDVEFLPHLPSKHAQEMQARFSLGNLSSLNTDPGSTLSSLYVAPGSSAVTAAQRGR